MTFFKQLNQLVKSLERDLNEFRTQDNCSQKSDEYDSLGQKALLAASTLQADMKNLGKSMTETSKSLVHDGGFLDSVAQVEALVSKQKSNMKKIEEYLQQYGYKPPPETVQKQALQADEPILIKAETVNNEKFPVDEIIENNTRSSQGECTPAKSSGEDYDEIMRTPRLEDFGLSEALLSKYNTYAASGKQSQPATVNNKSNGTLVRPMPMVPMYNAEAASSVPADFQHAGLCPTPGFTGGKDCSESPDTSFPLKTPQMLRSKPTFTSQETSLNESSEGLSLPDPPVLLTPGVKQMKRFDMHGNTSPVLNMGDMDQSPDGAGENGLASPVLPVLCTPGVKQLTRPAQVQSEESKKPVLSYADSCMDTPEMPELTVGWMGFKKLTGQCSEDAETSHVTNGGSGDPSTGVSDKPSLRINPAEMFANIGKTSQSTHDSTEDDDLPEMPELTTTLAFKTSTIFRKEETEGSSSQAQSSLLKSYEVDLSPLPQMPELTGTYNFSLQPAALTANTAVTGSLNHNSVDTRESNGEDYDYNKENVAPESSFTRTNSVCNKLSRLTEISESEYNKQPDYVQRIVSLEVLNKSIEGLEEIFLEQDQEGEEVGVRESDLQPFLGSRTKPVILCLTKLGRLKLSRQGQEPTYIPAT